MATLDDAYNQLVLANTNLTGIHNDLQAVNTSVQATTTAVESGFAQLDNLVNFTNTLLEYKIQQEQTIICILEKISRQTCELVNLGTRQTSAEEAMREELSDVKQLFEIANPTAAVEQHRLEELEEKVNKCCPPEVPPPPCTYEPCPAPKGPPNPPRGTAQ